MTAWTNKVNLTLMFLIQIAPSDWSPLHGWDDRTQLILYAAKTGMPYELILCEVRSLPEMVAGLEHTNPRSMPRGIHHQGFWIQANIKYQETN